jgi:hypothetical protein
MSGLSWLDGKSWETVTRDERTFCAELFYLVRENIGNFVEYLNEKHDAELVEAANWELAFEAVFYRDVHRHMKADVCYSGKRTFDLALLSDAQILIIEAKAQGGHGGAQLRTLEADCKAVTDLTGVSTVRVASLVSSEYSPKAETLEQFDGPHLNWLELANFYSDQGVPNSRLLRADKIFRR